MLSNCDDEETVVASLFGGLKEIEEERVILVVVFFSVRPLLARSSRALGFAAGMPFLDKDAGCTLLADGMPI